LRYVRAISFRSGEATLGCAVLVLDVGKTHSKLTLVSLEGKAPVVRTRANAVVQQSGLSIIDAAGIEEWLLATVRELSAVAHIAAIVPVAHGAAAALLRDDKLMAPVLDYEASPPVAVAGRYDAERDPFERTLSPRLPGGLNLGVQLAWHDDLGHDLSAPGASVLTWPQYWAHRLSGERASEVTSLGCHTDLWLPLEGEYSDLARARGWAGRFAPIRAANEVLGAARVDAVQTTRPPHDCLVLCGMHDSNASLFGARAQAQVSDGPFCLVATGTWFVAMQSGGDDPPRLDETRDTLGNVDIAGRLTPSARFMGGREYVAIAGDGGVAGSEEDAASLVDRGVATSGTYTAGCGPFPHSQGALVGEPRTPGERAALASLHLALLTDASLNLIGAEGPIVIEGRFAADPVFAAALAALRPQATVLRLTGSDGVALGAARLWAPDLPPRERAAPVAPLRTDLSAYADRWLDHVRGA
jgi:sugar (pentulose or hexulose) kinase